MSAMWPRIFAASTSLDPGEAGEGGAAGGHRVRAASAVVGCGLVEAPHVGEELSGHLLALGLDAVAGADLGEKTRRGVSAEVDWRAAGDQVAQVPVQPVDHTAPFAGQLVAAVREQPEHAMMIVRGDCRQIGAAGGDDSD